jgi:hypothetical protein
MIKLVIREKEMLLVLIKNKEDLILKMFLVSLRGLIRVEEVKLEDLKIF